MKRYLPVYLVFLLVCFGCSEQPWLSGTVDVSNGHDWRPTVYLVRPTTWGNAAQSFMGRVLDSAEIDDNGSFHFSNPLKIDGPVLLEVTVQKTGEKYPNKLINENPETDNYFPIVALAGEHINIHAEIDKFQSTFVVRDPSIANSEMMRLQNLKVKAYKEYIDRSADVDKSDEQLLEREKAIHEYQSRLMQFADSTQALLPALMAIKWASPEGDFERIPELLFQQSQKWGALAPDHPWVKELNRIADKEQLPVLVGDVFPNLILPMKTGELVPLQDVLKGNKILLLDIWASWCAPCRLENRNILVPLWEKYSGNGFEILAYGLESSQTAWDNAIEKDGANRWLHASHLLGDQNPFMDSLRLKTIPANFLLDGKGMVLAKNLHDKQLEVFVNRYMGQHQ